MKVKAAPSDFRVEELTDRTPEPAGGFALYRLEKAGWTTPDAVEAVRRRWKLHRDQLSFGGLKDRHALTTQHVTIADGPPHDLSLNHISLVYLGQSSSPFASADVRANRFAITLRDLTSEEATRIATAAPGVAAVGVPNYFDDQRFGSVSPGGEFVGRLLVKGEFEAALKLALTGPYEFDRSATKQGKAALRKHWGNWQECRHALPRDLGEFLIRNPNDFRGAIPRLHPELQGMHLAAYQSDLWNRTLSRWFRDSYPATGLVSIRSLHGPLPAPDRPRAAFDRLTIPLPSARMRPVPESPWWPALAAVLAEEELTLDQILIPGLRRPFFSKGERPACIRPEGLSAEPVADESRPGQKNLRLRFDLPRGAYATMVVKRLLVPQSPAARG